MTFVILHGVGLSHRFYGRLGRELSKSGDVVSFDLPGFGGSPRPALTLTIADYAAGVAQRLAALNAGPVVVIGHSMGVQVAAELALRHPDAVAHVVLIGPVVDPQHKTLLKQGLLLGRDAPREPRATQAAVLYDYIRCGVPWFLAASRVMRDYPLHRVVPRLTVPVTIVRGENDPIAGPAWCRELADSAVDGAVLTVAARRHNVPHADAGASAAAILTALRRGGPRPSV